MWGEDLVLHPQRWDPGHWTAGVSERECRVEKMGDCKDEDECVRGDECVNKGTKKE